MQRQHLQPSIMEAYTADSLASLMGASRWPHTSFLNRLSHEKGILPCVNGLHSTGHIMVHSATSDHIFCSQCRTQSICHAPSTRAAAMARLRRRGGEDQDHSQASLCQHQAAFPCLPHNLDIQHQGPSAHLQPKATQAAAILKIFVGTAGISVARLITERVG